MRSKGYVSAVVESGSLASENRPLASRGLTGRGPGGGGVHRAGSFLLSSSPKRVSTAGSVVKTGRGARPSAGALR